VVSYHLFLGCVVLYHLYSGEQKIGVSLSIPATIFTHLVFVAAAFGVVHIVLASLPKGYAAIPLLFMFSLLGVCRYGLCMLAVLEVNMLFQSTKSKNVPKPADKPTFIPVESNQEQEQFLQYLKGSKREYQTPGRGLSEEFDAWRLGQAKKRAAAAKALAR
jgi:hypothetical protein